MRRSILGIVAGLATWMVVATLLNFVLRGAIDGYAVAERYLAFTLPMMIARLSLGAASSLAAGAVAGWIAQWRTWVPWTVGAVILAFFVPAHVSIWPRLPVWYHLTFLVTLAPLVALGAVLAQRMARPTTAGPAQS
jgi:hypothetical protein